MGKIDMDKLSLAVMQELNAYRDETVEAMKEAVTKTAKETVKLLKGHLRKTGETMKRHGHTSGIRIFPENIAMTWWYMQRNTSMPRLIFWNMDMQSETEEGLMESHISNRQRTSLICW